VVSGKWCSVWGEAMEEGRFRLDDFEWYNRARELRRRMYRLINRLPPEEQYARGAPMRRAARSVTNNIAEGHGRWHYQENSRLCRISRGSVAEVIDDLNTCLDEGYIDPALVEDLKVEACDLNRRINGSIAYLRKTRQGAEEP
jgi:four helix bundle protein